MLFCYLALPPSPFYWLCGKSCSLKPFQIFGFRLFLFYYSTGFLVFSLRESIQVHLSKLVLVFLTCLWILSFFDNKSITAHCWCGGRGIKKLVIFRKRHKWMTPTFKVNNKDIKTMSLYMKTLNSSHWCCFGVFIVNFECISHFGLVFLLNFNR